MFTGSRFWVGELVRFPIKHRLKKSRKNVIVYLYLENHKYCLKLLQNKDDKENLTIFFFFLYFYFDK